MTAHVEIEGLRRRFGEVVALDGVDLRVERGHLLTVLGPSGCGKTTLLRIVAGFDRADAGRVRLGGREVDGDVVVPVHRRGVAVVPQEGALFPHLRVGENVGFGLRRGPQATRRVAEVLELVGLPGLQERHPHELSGGQQQRVAVARALAPRPDLVLLDEPFSALDAALRAGLRADVRAALRHDGATALLVTHDQAEALSVADEVAVMCAGRVVQCAPPEEVYRHPADPWVASFVGEATVLAARVSGDRAHTALGEVRLRARPPSADAQVLLRPEQVCLAEEGVPACVTSVTYHGHDISLTARLDTGEAVVVRSLAGARLPAVGARVRLRVDGELHVFPPATAHPGASTPGGEPGVTSLRA